MFVALGSCNGAQSQKQVSITQTIVSVQQWLGKEIKLNEESICEILVADTDMVPGAEASDVEDDFEEEGQQQQQQQQFSADVKNRLQ